MGSFYRTGFRSQITITGDDKVFALPSIEVDGVISPIGVPLIGRYSDYGELECHDSSLISDTWLKFFKFTENVDKIQDLIKKLVRSEIDEEYLNFGDFIDNPIMKNFLSRQDKHKDLKFKFHLLMDHEFIWDEFVNLGKIKFNNLFELNNSDLIEERLPTYNRIIQDRLPSTEALGWCRYTERMMLPKELLLSYENSSVQSIKFNLSCYLVPRIRDYFYFMNAYSNLFQTFNRSGIGGQDKNLEEHLKINDRINRYLLKKSILSDEEE